MRLTAGRVTATWLVLHSLRRLGGRASYDELMSYAKQSGLRAGGLPVRDGYSLSIRYGLVEKDAPLELSPLGNEIVSLCDVEEPTTDAIRVLVSIFLLKSPPDWVAIWQGKPELREFVMPDADRALLDYAGLLEFDGADLGASGWWDALSRVPLEVQTAGARKLTGDAGEGLTLAFERQRLTAEGFPELAAKIRWVAKESDAYGFDVLSYVGSHPTLPPATPLAIEVKSMAYPCGGQFRFFLTRHEYQTAQRFGVLHIFHLWDGVRAESASASRSGPWVRQLSFVEPHLPGKNECAERCNWTEAVVEVALNA